MTALVLIGVLLLLLALEFPVAIAMTGASVAYLLVRGDIPFVVVAQRVTVGVDSFVLLAIPFFFLAGELMNRGGSRSAWWIWRRPWSAAFEAGWDMSRW